MVSIAVSRAICTVCTKNANGLYKQKNYTTKTNVTEAVLESLEIHQWPRMENCNCVDDHFSYWTQTNLKIEETHTNETISGSLRAPFVLSWGVCARPSLDHLGHYLSNWGRQHKCNSPVTSQIREKNKQTSTQMQFSIPGHWWIFKLSNTAAITIVFVVYLFLLVDTIGIFGTDRAYRPRDRDRDHWEL